MQTYIDIRSHKLKVFFLVILGTSLAHCEISKRCLVNSEQDLIECRQVCMQSGGQLTEAENGKWLC
jgi:hypothetical protein